MTIITLVTEDGGRIPLAELEIREITSDVLSLRAKSMGGVDLQIGRYIKTEL